jgi:OTU domain-containing protein 3
MNFGKFSKQMEDLGLRIKEVKGDGNCLFRSVSDQVEGCENNHHFYRQSAVKFKII